MKSTYKLMTRNCVKFYTQVRKFTLVKETPRALRIRLENHPEKISIWMPKNGTRSYTPTSAWFWNKLFFENIEKEERKIKNKKQLYEDFNAIYVVNSTEKDIIKIEKIIDEQIDRKKD